MAKVIIFNAPPKTGKDYCADYMKDQFSLIYDTYKLQFKEKLFELTKSIYDIDNDTWDILYSREYKETPMDILGGLSPRQAMIYISEDVIKPKLGADYFGKHLAKQIVKDYNGVYFISDGGFFEEVYPLIYDKNIDLCVIKLDDGKHTFQQFKDSRRYLDLSNFPEVCEVDWKYERTVDNINALYDKIQNIIGVRKRE